MEIIISRLSVEQIIQKDVEFKDLKVVKVTSLSENAKKCCFLCKILLRRFRSNKVLKNFGFPTRNFLQSKNRERLQMTRVRRTKFLLTQSELCMKKKKNHFKLNACRIISKQNINFFLCGKA